MGSNRVRPNRARRSRNDAGNALHSEAVLPGIRHSINSHVKRSASDAPFLALAKLLGNSTLIFDADGTIHYATSTHRTHKSSVRRIVGRTIPSLIGKNNYRLLSHWIRQAWKSASEKYAEHQFQQPGSRRVLQSLVIPFDHRSPGAKRIALLLRDITPQKLAQDESRKNEALLLQAEELARIGSFQLDLRTGATVWSRQLYLNLHLNPAQAITHQFFLNMVHPEDRDHLRHEIQRAVARKEILDSDFRCILPDGEVRTFHRRAMPIYDDSGRPLSLIGMSQDITDRKRVEDELRSRESLLSQAEQLAQLGSWEWNIDTSEVIWSDHRYRLLGFDPQTHAPDVNAFWSRIQPEDRPRVRREFDAAIREARPAEYEARFVHPDGTVRILHSRGVPILNSEGRVVRMRGMAQDVTERRREEERLRHSEALLAQAEEIANVGSWEYDIDSRRATLSRNLLRMYGLQHQEDWSEEHYWRRIQASDVDVIRGDVTRAIEERRPFEFTAPYRLPDGTVRIYHTVGNCNSFGDRGARFLGVVHDITERTHIEENLRHLSQQLIRTRDSERRQLARGLHETAGQTLAALKMTLGNLAEFLPEDDTGAREQLSAARGFAEDAVREIRLVSYLMYPPLLDDAGLMPAVSWYVRGFSERSGITATVDIADGLGRYSQEIETTIFAIVQEALTNVHRYSGSTTVTVRLHPEADSIRAEIEDQGCGLPLMPAARGQSSTVGVGIAGMRERVNELNGSFEILSTPGRGTLVRAILPVLRQSAVSSPLVRKAQN